jgi:hypothetical protein
MARMSQTYGIEAHGQHEPAPHRKPVRYVIVIDAGGSAVAMLFLESRELVAEIDAGAEEVNSMISGIQPDIGVLGAEWNAVLGGHSTRDRAEARLYTLGI